jgi:hypothetical protein
MTCSRNSLQIHKLKRDFFYSDREKELAIFADFGAEKNPQ